MNGQRRLTVIASVLLLTVGLLGVAPPSVAIAEQHPPVTLTSTSDTASWSGEFPAGVFGVWPVAALPEACTPDVCDMLEVDVQLPENTWQPRPGGMLVAIQPPVLEIAGLDLFVYAPGCSPATCSPTASSTSILSSEAAWVENPTSGRYTVVVTATLVAGQPLGDGVAEPLRYDGFVTFQRGLTVQREELNFGQPYTRQIVAFGLSDKQPARELLPDLVPTTPRNFQIAYGSADAQVPGGCLPTETLGLHDDEPTPDSEPTTEAARCLRFDQGEYNLGDGPFQLNVYEPDDGTFEVYQRIYASDGDVRPHGPLGEVEFSDAHGHFHYLGFQEITLHRIEQDGSLTFVKKKPDKGICTADIEMGRFGRTDAPTAPLGYPYLNEGTCATFTHEDPNDPTYPGEPFFEMGISVGWADVYSATLPEQSIEITDRTKVPDGDYALVVRQDVEAHVREISTTNNTAIGCVRITGDEAEEITCDIGGRQP